MKMIARMQRRGLVISVCLLLSAVLVLPHATAVKAWWSEDSTEGTAICTARSNQYWPESISDGSGGAIITWEDGRSGSCGVYAQKVNFAGAAQWAADGVAISGNQCHPQIISDGSGGAIITWTDWRRGNADTNTNSDIYAQRVDSSGNLVDTAPPTVTLTSTVASPKETSPIPVTATFSETVTGFTLDDIVVGNGTASNFVSMSGTLYTFEVTPSGQGVVTLDMAANVAQDAVGKGNEAASYSADDSAPSALPSGSTNWGLIVGIIGGILVLGAVAGWLIISRRKA